MIAVAQFATILFARGVNSRGAASVAFVRRSGSAASGARFLPDEAP